MSTLVLARLRRLAAAVLLAGAMLAGGAATSASTPAADPKAGPRTIVYWTDSPWPSIWLTDASGSRARRILNNRQNAKRPRLSPDGRLVAFDGTPPGKPPLTDFDIQVVRLNGTGLRTLTHGRAWDADPQWSPDGRRLAFSRSEPHPQPTSPSSIWVIRRDGRGLRRVTEGFGARWSPSGRRMVVEGRSGAHFGDLVLLNADGKSRRVLVDGPATDYPADWSPDGKKVLFTRLHDRAGYIRSVFVINVAGTGLRKLDDGAAAAWSSDGRRILYVKRNRLAMMNPDGTGKRLLEIFGYEPDWR
jgi:Tol biopolymer transport system component